MDGTAVTAEVRVENAALSPELAGLVESAALTFDSDRDAAREYIARACALLRAHRARRRNDSEENGKPPRRGGLAPWQLKRVLAHIDANVGRRIRTADLTQLTGLSASHLARAFKTSLGVPPI